MSKPFFAGKKMGIIALTACLLLVSSLALVACGSNSGGTKSSNTGEKKSYRIPVKEVDGISGVFIPEKKYEAICVIVGNTANEPAPQIEDDVAVCLNLGFIDDPSIGKVEISYISAAGGTTHDPIKLPDLPKASPGGNEKNDQNTVKSNAEEVAAALSQDPKVNHVDFFGALKKANLQLKNCSGDKLIIVIGSGLNDAGDLNFAKNTDLINQDPSSIAQTILSKQDSNVSSTTLEKCDVIWTGLGGTALPQPELQPQGNNSVDNLKAIYTTLIEHMGGKVIICDTGTSDPDLPTIKTEYKVTPFVYSNDPLVWSITENSKEWHLADNSLSFEKGSAAFTDANAAENTLKTIADEVNANSKARITITGYESAAGREITSTSDWGKPRAQAVSDVLVNKLGVDKSKIVDVLDGGMGTFAPELDENGNVIDEATAFNRVVVISVQY